MTINGSGLAGNVSTHVNFAGPANVSVEVFDASSQFIELTLPTLVTVTAGHYTVTVDALDDTGNRHIGTGGFDVVQPAVVGNPIIFSPEVVVAEATSSTGANVFFIVTATSAGGTPEIATCTRNGAPISSGALFPLGSSAVHCSVTDVFGTANADFNVVVADTTRPVLHLPAIVTSTSTTVSWTTSATDTVDGTVNVICTPPSGSTFPNGTTVVTCEAVDAHNNVTRGSFPVVVTQTPPPSLNLPDDIFVEAAAPNGTSVNFTATTDADATVSCSPVSGTTFPINTTEVVCTASRSSITTSGAFNVTVVDTTPPSLTVPANINTSNPVVTYSVSATDVADAHPAITCFPASGSVFPAGTTTVNCTAHDFSSNSSQKSFTVTIVSDNTPPVLSLPSDITAEATGPNGAVVTFTATANDNIDGPVPVTCLPSSGSLFALGTTAVQCSAHDAAGNPASGSFNVIVRDTTAPFLTLPSDISAEATSAAGAVVTFSTMAFDLVDGSRPVTCLPASGATFPLGATTVQCNSTDLHGNTSGGSFKVTVVDTTPPTVNVPADITKEASGPSGASVAFTVTATDLVDGNVTATCAPPSGSTFPLGTTTVQCSATDLHGNTGHGSFHVNVVDTTPPVVTSISASPDLLWPPDHKMNQITVKVTANDLVDPNPGSQITAVSSNQPIDGTGDGDTSPDWVITGPLSVDLRSERAGDKDRVYTLTVITFDASDNITTSYVQVRVSQTSRGRGVRH